MPKTWNSDGVKVQQMQLTGLEKTERCKVCGRLKRKDSTCKRDRHEHTLNFYVNNEYKINNQS